MPYLQYPSPRSKYCRNHGREYLSYCPECARDREIEELERLVKKSEKTDQDKKFQTLLDGIFDKKDGI